MPKRNPFEARPVRSRRGGPVKEPLSRDAIVAEALRQITTRGVEGTSLRKVAAALDTGPASLYAYIDDLGELHALVLDRALAKVSLRRAPNSSWRERLQRVLKSYAWVLNASPGLAQLACGAIAVGPNALRIAETVRELLEEGGVDPATAAWAVELLVLFVTASAAERSKGMGPAATREARFTWALEVLLEGLVHSRNEHRSSRP
jgi:AcrR family transcriptional regulator